MIENYSIPNQAVDINNNSFYSTGCIDEVNKALSQCSHFKTEVTDILGTKFKIALIILFILIVFKIVTEYKDFKFVHTEWFKFLIRRIDWVILLLIIMLTAYFFI